MTNRPRLGARWSWWVARTVLGLALATLPVLAFTAPAAAHAALLNSDPLDGAVVPVSPTIISFTFDETVRLPPNAVQVFDASGTAVPVEGHGQDSVISATLTTPLGQGTYVVAWRAISGDGHVVSGSITFSVGAPSTRVAVPSVPTAANTALTNIIAIANGLNYLGLLLGGGLILFVLWVSNGLHLDKRLHRRLTLVTSAAMGLSVATAAVLVTAHGAEALSLGPGGLARPWSLQLHLARDDLLVLGIQAIALPTALLLSRHRWAATGAVLLALASPSIVGHSRTTTPEWLGLATDIVHLAAGAAWLGGLVGLTLLLPKLSHRERDFALVLARFSTLGATTLAALLATGTLATWRIVDSWSALVHTTYGRLLLVKIGIVALTAAVAGANRFLLLPHVQLAVDHLARSLAMHRLRRAVQGEALLLVGVLALTGVLTELSPNESPNEPSVAASQVATAEVENNDVRVTVSPGLVGPNTVTVQLRNQVGEPSDLYAAPTLSVSNGEVDLGQIPVESVAPATYSGEVILPEGGTWHVEVGLRITQFDNPVTTVDVAVR